ncbi:MAG: type II secretion system ATPase GspE [Desulfobacteraceae bacterium]|jgi:general secretion pathway protein E
MDTIGNRKENALSSGGNGGPPAAAEPNERERLLHAAQVLGLEVMENLLSEMAFEDTLGIPIQYYRKMGIVPLRIESDVLTVALSDPMQFRAADDLGLRAGCSSVRLVLSLLEEVHEAINLLFDRSSGDAERMVEDLEASGAEEGFGDFEELDDLMETTHEAPVIRVVNGILTQALRRGASDIHVEPYERQIAVRFRVDGVLHEIMTLPKRFHAHLVSRVKVMADLDIAEKRVPQDGRMKVRVANRTVDIRISIIPMTFGERIVLRLLDKGVSLLGLREMGMAADTLGLFERFVNRSSGILLVTGPTGSGKTTTLYAALSRINSAEKNVITIEDPVEYELGGVGQIQVNPKTDLTFARGLRSMLRHDPDIIMVGEIRDLETVEIAIQASLTGHLVFSTLHTNDAAGAVTRLVDMGVEPFLIASSLLGVLAQRLVRKICPACKEPYHLEGSRLKELGLQPDQELWHGAGCEACMGTGYQGRTGIFELLPVDEGVRRLVTSGADSVRIREIGIEAGMRTLYMDGIEKVKQGVTTLDEVLRVTQE